MNSLDINYELKAMVGNNYQHYPSHILFLK